MHIIKEKSVVYDKISTKDKDIHKKVHRILFWFSEECFFRKD